MVSSIIEREKREHRELLLTFNYIRYYLDENCIVQFDITKALRVMKRLLNEHLHIEDEELYGKLTDSKIPELVRLSKKFAEEMLAISEKAHDFLDRYAFSEEDLKNNEEFRMDLREIIKIVSERIVVEERVLFPAYERHFGS